MEYMRHTTKRGALLAAIGVLVLTAACSHPSAGKNAASTGAHNAATTPSTNDPGPTGSPGGNGGNSSMVVTAKNLADYAKVAKCVQKHGVKVPDPKVGEPFDASAMDKIAMTDKWNKILGDCKDWV